MAPETVALIKTCFAGQDALVERAYSRNAAFRSACEDFRACSEALAHWNRSDLAGALPRRREYAELLVELDREIQRWLEVLETASAPDVTRTQRKESR